MLSPLNLPCEHKKTVLSAQIATYHFDLYDPTSENLLYTDLGEICASCAIAARAPAILCGMRFDVTRHSASLLFGDIFTIIRLLWVYRDEIDLTADDPEAWDD